MTILAIPELPLNSSSSSSSCVAKKIPVLAIGTVSHPPVGPEVLREAILDAIKIGHRHFDTAALYNTEKPLGQAVAEAISLGLVGSRDELFITSKLWCSEAYADRVLPAIRESLKNLELEYLDLYLIHFPLSIKPSDFPKEEEDIQPIDIWTVWEPMKNIQAIDLRGVWEAMEECQRLGLTKSIGVSNFTCKKLADLLLFANIPPVVNQVEMSPVWQQKKLREFCKANKIILGAYTTLGAKGTPWGTNRVMDSPVLKQIADARGKTVAQVCLRWAYEQGDVIVVKSFNKERMKENLQIFDWELSEEDSEKISEIPQSKTIPCDFFVSENGPFKSLQEFWDGEI